MKVDETRLTATYLLANNRHGTLYLGSTLDLLQRMHEHRIGKGSHFTTKYRVARLVWFERFMLLVEARAREYQMKRWRRDWKVNLIERDNPHWDDLSRAISGAVLPTRIVREARERGRLIEAPAPGFAAGEVRGPLSRKPE